MPEPVQAPARPTTQDIVDQLRTLSDRLVRSLDVPDIAPGMSIKEAFMRLRPILPASISIELKLMSYWSDDSPHFSFSIWDGKKCVVGPDLAQCVATVEKAHVPQPVCVSGADALVAADAALNGVTAKEEAPY